MDPNRPVGPDNEALVGYLNPGGLYPVAPFMEGRFLDDLLGLDPASAPRADGRDRVVVIDPVGDSCWGAVRERLEPRSREDRSIVRFLERRLRLIEERLNARAANGIQALATEMWAAQDPNGSSTRVPRIAREDREEWERCVGLWVRAVRREARRRRTDRGLEDRRD